MALYDNRGFVLQGLRFYNYKAWYRWTRFYLQDCI